MMTKRHFLFLQGVASPFFARLADHLAAQGHRVSRINFCTGDALYWGRRPAWNFANEVAELADYLQTLFARHPFTDLVLFGSRRPVHLPAIALAEEQGIRVHVFEEGYIRPNWLTLERGGVNADSSLPSNPDWYLAVAPHLPTDPVATAVDNRLRPRAAHDLVYHLANCLDPLLFAGYRTHRPHGATTEYLGWIRRFTQLAWQRRNDDREIRKLLAAESPYFLLPLQLNADVQITRHSGYTGMPHLIDATLRSFAQHAPAQSRLLIKNHPLDTGLVPYRRVIADLASELGISERVVFLESGPLDALLPKANGVITVNSTVGMTALELGCPTIALGRAIYDLPGLTFQGPLDAFWTQTPTPQPQLFRAFRDVVMLTTQVNGNLYTSRGIRQAIANCDRLLAPISPLQQMLSQYPTDSRGLLVAESAT
ncbi:MAG: capsular biosynthesis protein [Woeseiaceae bacterium]|nr:capsular biosynthesis protein [Woeseiaceae bacterium]